MNWADVPSKPNKNGNLDTGNPPKFQASPDQKTITYTEGGSIGGFTELKLIKSGFPT